MKCTTLFLLPFIFSTYLLGQQKQEIDRLVAFAKAYGYVKYFHPSDEASQMDWNTFAIYGADKILAIEDQQELSPALNKLFSPIAPLSKFSPSDQLLPYDTSLIIPSSLADYEITYWQHRGVGMGMSQARQTYKSRRVNRQTVQQEVNYFGSISLKLDPQSWKGKRIRYRAWVKVESIAGGSGHLWMRMDRADRSMVFFDNMQDRPIRGEDWQEYEILAEVDSLAATLHFGAFLTGEGKMYVDQVQLSYESSGQWVRIPLKDGGFEGRGFSKKEGYWSKRESGYAIGIQQEVFHEGKRAVLIKSGDGSRKLGEKALFDQELALGEIIEKEIGADVTCQIPMVLCASEASTYPVADKEALDLLKKSLSECEMIPENLAFRLGNVINTYNVFQHFYPYFDVVEVDWEQELRKALIRSFSDQTANDHWITLQKLTASLKDGHILVRGGSPGNYAPPFSWEWVEEKLVITGVFAEDLPVKIGDIVSHVNEVPARTYFDEVNSRISAGTQGWLNYRAGYLSLVGEKDSQMKLTINNKQVTMNRSQLYSSSARNSAKSKPVFRKIEEHIYYLNLDMIEMKEIRKHMRELKGSKAIICDLRGYPNRNDGFISYLLKNRDTTSAWMKIPQIIYPDQERSGGYKTYNWLKRTQKPYLGDKKIVFIIDGRAISYAESYMGYIEGYNLATIVGQPTAGTNGNVNAFILPGGFRIRWTGMKVVKHDGSQLHGIGILPDVHVEKTIAGIMEGRDEFLEKALEIARQ